jgi:hypothetical protein
MPRLTRRCRSLVPKMRIRNVRVSDGREPLQRRGFVNKTEIKSKTSSPRSTQHLSGMQVAC